MLNASFALRLIYLLKKAEHADKEAAEQTRCLGCSPKTRLNKAYSQLTL